MTAEDLRRNQNIFLFFFMYSAFSGALRKWVFMGNSGVNNIILVIQLLMPFALVALMKREKPAFSYFPLVPYAILLTFFAANPMNMTIFHGIFGFILHFGFWLMLFTYVNERAAFPLEKLIQPFIIVCLIQGIISFFQFTMPIDSLINRYESGESTSGFEGGMVRVSGTFSYIGGYAAFLYFFGFLIWALMIEQKQRTGVLILLAVFAIFGSFMNGSRTTTLFVGACIGFGFLTYGKGVDKVRVVVIAAFLLIFTSIFNLTDRFSAINAAYDAFMGRVEYGQRTGESGNRAYETVIETLSFDSANPLFGLGLGATYQGATQTWGVSHYLKAYGFYEEEPERILLEGGYALLFIRALLFGLMIKQLKIPLIYAVPTMIYLFFFAQMVSSTFQSCFTFFGIAIVDKMYYLRELKTVED